MSQNFKAKSYWLILLLIHSTILCCSSKNFNSTKQKGFFNADDLRCEYRINPIGIDVAQPQLSWILRVTDISKRGLTQTAYQIMVASSHKLLTQNQGDLWNSGKVTSNQTSGNIYCGTPLKTHQVLWWKVRVWDQNGNASNWSNINQWTMGILNQDWSGAIWISAPSKYSDAKNSTFLLRREFSVKAGLKRAIVSICGLGQYEMTVNGSKTSESLLNPGWTVYTKTCLYDTYDLTSLIHEGKNAIGLLLGNGMYRVEKGERYTKFQSSFGRLQAIAKIRLEFEDGSVNTLITDGQWRAGESPMTYSNIYGGEDWDARKVEKNWDKGGFNDSGWSPVELLNGPGGILRGVTYAAPPIHLFKVYKASSLKEFKSSNATIYDLGQNASYISRLIASGPAGSVIKITPGELLNSDSTLFINNYNGKSFSQFTLSGTGEESYTSKFFNTGCRYYKIQCLPAPGNNQIPKVKSIDGIVIHSDSYFDGDFACSNELFNRIYKMIRWAELSNMKSVISDCPHRERLGWLEQSHLHGPSFRYNYDMRPLVRKIINDMKDSQLDNGLIPCIAPELTVFGPDWREAIEWGTAGVLLPWQQYEWTGDVEILRQNFPMMKGYVNYLTHKAKNGIAAEGKGDWSGRNASPQTPRSLIATAFYYNNVKVLAKSARLLGDSAAARAHESLAKSIRNAFDSAFFHADTKQYGSGSQCANAMALTLDLVDSVNRKAVLANLVTDIENRKYENTTGEVGMEYLLRALADGGRSDIVYNMNNQSEKPGYGYQLKMGATALPETWDAYPDNSQNQFMLGHIIEWFYHDLAGIQMDPETPGFRKIIIHPNVIKELTEVKGSYNSIRGKITSEWKLNGKNIILHVVIPPNTTATIHIPAKGSEVVTEKSRLISEVKNLKFIKMDGSYALVEAGSGDYTFSSLMW